MPFVPASASPSHPLARLALRMTIFTMLVFVKILLIWWLARGHGADLFSEDSPLEWLQFATLVVCSVAFAQRARRDDNPLAWALASLAAMAAVREMDKTLDAWIPLFGWQLPFYLALLGGSRQIWKSRTRFFTDLPAFTAHRSFGMLWAGFIIAIPFAQMIGHGPFLQALFDGDYQRPMKRIIEECAESIGYLILLFGAIDWLLDGASQPANTVASVP